MPLKVCYAEQKLKSISIYLGYLNQTYNDAFCSWETLSCLRFGYKLSHYVMFNQGISRVADKSS